MDCGLGMTGSFYHRGPSKWNPRAEKEKVET
jgi:hypothetical protein